MATESTMNVQVRAGNVRSAPSFLGPVRFSVSYGDELQVLEKAEGWVKVSSPSGSDQGWIHESALTARKIVIDPTGRDLGRTVESDEIALGGRGFNAQVEEAYQKENPTIDFTWIDRMEAIEVSPDEIAEFLRQGDLNPSTK